jgi:hypothetical protein
MTMTRTLNTIFGISLLAFAATLLSGTRQRSWAADAGSICSSGTSNPCKVSTTTTHNCTREVIGLTGMWECMEYTDTVTTTTYYWSVDGSGGGTLPQKKLT